MNDDPFKTTKGDVAHTSARAALSAIPVLGGPAAEFFSLVVAQPAQSRRDDFLKGIYERIKELENKFETLKPEMLAKNEAFQATCIQAAQAAVRTSDESKRKALRNAVLNSAVEATIDETKRQMFMNYLERFTPLHIALLKLLDNPTKNPAVAKRLENVMAGGLADIVEVAIPQLRQIDRFADVLVGELDQMNMVDGAGLRVTMTGQGLAARRTTNLGREFLKFVADPETGEVPV